MRLTLIALLVACSPITITPFEADGGAADARSDLSQASAFALVGRGTDASWILEHQPVGAELLVFFPMVDLDAITATLEDNELVFAAPSTEALLMYDVVTVALVIDQGRDGRCSPGDEIYIVDSNVVQDGQTIRMDFAMVPTWPRTCDAL